MRTAPKCHQHLGEVTGAAVLVAPYDRIVVGRLAGALLGIDMHDDRNVAQRISGMPVAGVEIIIEAKQHRRITDSIVARIGSTDNLAT